MRSLFDAIKTAYDRRQENGNDTSSMAPMLRRLCLSAAGATRLSPFRPFLYPTPDGALHPASPQSLFSPVRQRSTASRSPDARRRAETPSHQTACDALSLARAAVDEGLMDVLISICAATTAEGDTLFSLEERVEALYAVVYLTHRAGADLTGEEDDVMGGVDSLICKIDLLQLATTACDLLRQVAACLAEPVGAADTKSGGGGLRRAFLAIASAVTMLLGCREPRHWGDDLGGRPVRPSEEIGRQRLLAGEKDCHGETCNDDEDYLAGGEQNFFLRPADREQGCCLCCGATPLLYQFMMAALTEHGLWQQLWRRLALPFLPEPRQEKRQDEAKEDDDEDEEADSEKEETTEYMKETPESEEESDNTSSTQFGPLRTLGVRLTLKMMTLLLLRSAAAEQDLASILCRLAPYEEEEMDKEWRALPAHTSHPQLSEMEKRTIYTLRRLSSFLTFRRVSCYAANAMHVLLTRLLVLPPHAGVDVGVVLDGFLFMRDTPPVLTRVAHVLAFHLAIHPGDGLAGDHAATMSYELVIPAALLSSVLLLDTKHMNGRVMSALTPLHEFRAALESSAFQSALAAGIGRVHQAAVLLCAVAGTTAPETMRLEATHAIAFSRLVQPSPPAPLYLRRKRAVTEMWAETFTVDVCSAAPVGPAVSPTRRRKAQSSFSCVVTSAVRPGTEEARHVDTKNAPSEFTAPHVQKKRPEQKQSQEWRSRNNSQDHDATKNEAERGETQADDHGCALQVYVRTTQPEEQAMSPHKNNHGQHSHTTSRVLPHVEGLPPMTFGNEPMSSSDRVRASDGRSLSPHGQRSHLNIDTFFLCRDGSEYCRVVECIPCSATLHREKMNYTAAVDLILMASPTQRDMEWPWSAAILSCSTLHGDELHLHAHPPRQRQTHKQQPHQQKSSPRVDKAAVLCSAKRAEARNGLLKFQTEQHSPSYAAQTADSMGPSQPDEDALDDLDAYVASLKPAPLLDMELAQRDSEIAQLRAALESATAQEGEALRCMREAVTQRDELQECLINARLEAEMCYTDIVNPLHREVTQLRRTLTLRNRELCAALALCRRLREENGALSVDICDVRRQLEEIVEAHTEGKTEG